MKLRPWLCCKIKKLRVQKRCNQSDSQWISPVSLGRKSSDISPSARSVLPRTPLRSSPLRTRRTALAPARASVSVDCGCRPLSASAFRRKQKSARKKVEEEDDCTSTESSKKLKKEKFRNSERIMTTATSDSASSLSSSSSSRNGLTENAIRSRVSDQDSFFASFEKARTSHSSNSSSEALLACKNKNSSADSYLPGCISPRGRRIRALLALKQVIKAEEEERLNYGRQLLRSCSAKEWPLHQPQCLFSRCSSSVSSLSHSISHGCTSEVCQKKDRLEGGVLYPWLSDDIVGANSEEAQSGRRRRRRRKSRGSVATVMAESPSTISLSYRHYHRRASVNTLHEACFSGSRLPSSRRALSGGNMSDQVKDDILSTSSLCSSRRISMLASHITRKPPVADVHSGDDSSSDPCLQSSRRMLSSSSPASRVHAINDDGTPSNTSPCSSQHSAKQDCLVTCHISNGSPSGSSACSSSRRTSSSQHCVTSASYVSDDCIQSILSSCSSRRVPSSRLGATSVSATYAEHQHTGVAVVKRSQEPYLDFRDSMLDMIVENRMNTASELQDLLQRFLSLNSRLHHRTIVQAFVEVWENVFGSSLPTLSPH